MAAPEDSNGIVSRLTRRVRLLIRTFVFEQLWDGDTHGAPGAGAIPGDRRPYIPSSWLVLPTALRHRPPSPSDVFLDVGSGKGRVVLQAARYPYRRVIGLELSEELTDIARTNVERNRRRLRTHDIELVTGDIIDYEIPGDVTTVYCFNAMYGRPFEALMERMVELADRRGAPVTFIYSFPDEHERLVAHGRIRHVGRLTRGLLSGANPTSFYEVLPAYSTIR